MSEFSSTSYRTSDLYFAAYLRVAGVVFQGVEEDRGKTIFLFEDQGVAIMKDLKNAFFMDTAKVTPLSYSQSIRSMKALVLRK